jgi:hypothetical protein
MNFFNFFKKKKKQNESSSSSHAKDAEASKNSEKILNELNSSLSYRSKSRDELIFHPFPDLNITEKPGRDEFKELKKKFVNEAFESVYEYYVYVTENEYISSKKEIKEIIEITIKQFIEFFWDLPASRDVNYTERFGLLKKSLQLACKRADYGENLYVYTGHSTISSERTRICKPYYILVEFVLGLFNNASTIFNVNITSEKNNKLYTFYPFWGSLLNYKMVFPDVQTKWTKFSHEPRLNYILLIYLTPFSFIQVLPDEVRSYFLDKFVKEGTESEQKPITILNNHKLQNKLDYIQNEISQVYKSQPSLIDVYKLSSIFQISSDYYIITKEEFFRLMYSTVSLSQDEALEFFIDSKLIVTQKNNAYSIRIPFYYTSDIKKAENDRRKSIESDTQEFIFIKSTFFDPIVQSVEGNTGQFVESIIKFDVNSSLVVRDFLGSECSKIPNSIFFNPDAKKNNNSGGGSGGSGGENQTENKQPINKTTPDTSQEQTGHLSPSPAHTVDNIIENKATFSADDIPDAIINTSTNEAENDSSVEADTNATIEPPEHDTIDQRIDSYLEMLDDTLPFQNKKKKTNAGFIDSNNNLYVYFFSIIKACFGTGECTLEISQVILKYLYDAHIIDTINDKLFQKISISYYVPTKDPLIVPDAINIESHFVKIDQSVIEKYAGIKSVVDEISQLNKKMKI